MLCLKTIWCDQGSVPKEQAKEQTGVCTKNLREVQLFYAHGREEIHMLMHVLARTYTITARI